MIHLEDSVLIRRSAQNIFDFLINPDNNAVWRSAVIASWKLSDGPVGVGSAYAEKMRFVRQTLEAAYTVTTLAPNQKFVAESDADNIWFRISYDLEKVADGTNVKFTIEARFIGAMTIVEPVVNAMFINDIPVDMTQLKRIMENTAMLNPFDSPYDGLPAVLGS